MNDVMIKPAAKKLSTVKMEVPVHMQSLNLKLNKKGELVIPEINPVNNQALTCITDKGTPLIPMKKQLQKTIDFLPIPQDTLWKQACSGDTITNKSWKNKWNEALSKNEKKYNFSELSCIKFYQKEAYKPVIIAGSGPSLKNNAKYLNKTYTQKIDLSTGKEVDTIGGGREDIKIVSCLHNFPFFEDNYYMTPNDYYVNLDAGDLTISEMTEGGKHDESWYWEKTRERTLITTVLSNPKLLEKWQGKIFFFKTGSSAVENYTKRVDPSKVPLFSVGGNVLGASLYFAKAILGAGDIVFIGADFCFSYDHKFHAWDSQYDQQFKGVVPCTDIFGNRVFSWMSYVNFKSFFEYIACGGMGSNPQIFINATEGGILGSYPEGNIRQIKQMSLKEVLHVYTMHKKIPELMNNKEKEIVLF